MKLNIAEILKDCPKGMELDSPIIDELYFDEVTEDNMIKCSTERPSNSTCTCNSIYFDCEGTYITHIKAKCVIFPKGKTTWEGFQRPFKDGDVIFIHANCLKVGVGNTWISIYKENRNGGVATYVDYAEDGDGYYSDLDGDKALLCMEKDILRQRFATEEEKQKLFDAIKTNGYKWNTETKTLEKLIVPKFKVGDRIKSKNIYTNCLNDNHIFTITEISSGRYWSNQLAIEYIEKQDDWELVPNKFDITTLKPFDRVLTRVTTGDVWGSDFFGYYKDRWFHCCGHIATHYCIPYENNEHLLGTTNDCDDYYKTWR